MKAAKKTWRNRFSKWWRGEFKTYDTPGVFGFYMERHWTATAARSVVSFYMKHWQWVWSTLIALAALVASLKLT